MAKFNRNLPSATARIVGLASTLGRLATDAAHMRDDHGRFGFIAMLAAGTTAACCLNLTILQQAINRLSSRMFYHAPRAIESLGLEAHERVDPVACEPQDQAVVVIRQAKFAFRRPTFSRPDFGQRFERPPPKFPSDESPRRQIVSSQKRCNWLAEGSSKA